MHLHDFFFLTNTGILLALKSLVIIITACLVNNRLIVSVVFVNFDLHCPALKCIALWNNFHLETCELKTGAAEE